MKILLLSTYENYGGAAIACKRLYHALTKYEGVEVKLLVLEKQTSDPNISEINRNSFQKKLSKLKLGIEKLLFLPFEKDKTVRFQFSLGKFGLDISNHKLVKWADIIHMHWINNCFLSIKSIGKLQKLEKPIIWTMHDMWAFTGIEHYSTFNHSYKKKSGNSHLVKHPKPNDISHKVWLKKKKTYRDISFIGCSEWISNLARKSSLLKNFEISSIPNPIDCSLFYPIEKEKCQDFFNIKTKKKIILFGAFSTSDNRKGYQYLRSALEILTKEERQKILLVFFGNGTNDIPEYIETKFLGKIDHEKMPLAYNLADVFVTPSLEDNLPNTIMEALACNIPCVAFDIGGIGEMIITNKTGYLSKYQNEKDLSNGIKTLLFRNLNLKNQPRSFVLNYSEEKKVAKQYVEFYKKLYSFETL